VGVDDASCLRLLVSGSQRHNVHGGRSSRQRRNKGIMRSESKACLRACAFLYPSLVKFRGMNLAAEPGCAAEGLVAEVMGGAREPEKPTMRGWQQGPRSRTLFSSLAAFRQSRIRWTLASLEWLRIAYGRSRALKYSACFVETNRNPFNLRLHLKATQVPSAMHQQSISVYVETIRQELNLIENQEIFYRKAKYHTPPQIAAHVERGSRLLEIRTQLQRLRKI